MSVKIQAIEYAILASLAGAGGVARFLVGRMEPNAPDMTLKKFLFMLAANVFVSGFSGLMGAMVVASTSSSDTLRYVAAGVFGFLGVKGLEYIADRFTQKI